MLMEVDNWITHFACLCVRILYSFLLECFFSKIDGGWHHFWYRWVSNMAWLVSACIQVYICILNNPWKKVQKKRRDFWLFALCFVVFFFSSVFVLFAIRLPIRSIIMMWFLWELRNTMKYEHSTRKLDFLLHFGASSLVWFIYLPIIAIIASQVSPMWRYKLLLGEFTTAGWKEMCAFSVFQMYFCVQKLKICCFYSILRYNKFSRLFRLLCDDWAAVAEPCRPVLAVGEHQIFR